MPAASVMGGLLIKQQKDSICQHLPGEFKASNEVILQHYCSRPYWYSQVGWLIELLGLCMEFQD